MSFDRDVAPDDDHVFSTSWRRMLLIRRSVHLPKGLIAHDETNRSRRNDRASRQVCPPVCRASKCADRLRHDRIGHFSTHTLAIFVKRA